MKNITILLHQSAQLSAVFGARHMFSMVNQFYSNDGRAEPFCVQLAAATAEVRLMDGKTILIADNLLNEIERTDLIIVPPINGDIEIAIESNAEMIRWILDRYNKGSEVASLCNGAFILAASGLLGGKSCSTHWLFKEKFRMMFPDVDLLADAVVTDHRGLYSSGGATTIWNLLLYLVEKFTDRATAIYMSKFFLLDISLASQSPFVIFKGQRTHADDAVLKAQDFIEANFAAKLTTVKICETLKLNRRTFERRFRKATSNSIMEYLQRVRIESAKKRLETKDETIKEIMFSVGYTDLKAFRDVFRKYTSYSPIAYRNKYK